MYAKAKASEGKGPEGAPPPGDGATGDRKDKEDVVEAEFEEVKD